MINSIKCPKCGEEIEISKAIVDEQVESARKDALKQAEETAREERKRLNDQIADLLKELRDLKRKDEEREVELQKKAIVIEEKAREEAGKKAKEETDLQIAQKDKKLADLEKQLEEMRKTAQQGSQQTQGEVLELELEQSLRREFPNDVISEVAKGVRGGGYYPRGPRQKRAILRNNHLGIQKRQMEPGVDPKT